MPDSQIRFKVLEVLNVTQAFSSFSANDIQKAREFYGKTLGSNFPPAQKAPWLCPFPVTPKL
jgi:hypothetical protein